MSNGNGFVRFGKTRQLTCSLAVSGEFPDYNPGQAYTGTVNITGATGATTVDLVSGTPPSGFTIDTITSPDRVRVQWPVIPPSIDPNTRALLHMDGANGSTTFTDVVGANWTMNGSATVSTTQSKFGGASAGFNGSSYLISGDRAAMSLTGTDWTIEAFVYCNTHLGNIASSRQAPNGLTFRVQGGKLEAFYGEGQGFIIADTSHPTLTWFHAAITKQGNTVRLYQNGVIVGTNTWSVDINNTATPYMAIGAYYPFVGGIQEPFNGYIDEFRVSSVARYGSSNFTPPTAPFSGSEGGGVSTLGNLNFESGDTSWIKGYGWTITNTGLADGGAWSAKYNGVGQSNLAHVTAAPVNPGTSITASCRVSKGANREDYAGGAVVLQWFDANLNPLGFNVGNVVNTGTSAFQTSSVTATAPTGAAFVRLAGSGTRDVKGRASDLVYLDSFSWNHTFALGGSGTGATPITGPIPLTFRVRDANGCTAVATRTIGQITAGWLGWVTNTQTNLAGRLFSADFGATWQFATAASLGMTTVPAVVDSGVSAGEVLMITSSETTTGGNADNRILRFSGSGGSLIADSHPSLTSTAGGNREGIAEGASFIWRSAQSPGFGLGVWRAASGAMSSWTFQSLGAFQNSTHMAFAPTAGLLVSSWFSRDYVMFSTNNGSSWTQSSAIFASNANLLAVAASDTHAFVLGPSGSDFAVRRSTNGSSWGSNLLTIPAANNPQILYATRGGVVLVGCSNGTVYRSTDNGLNWSNLGNVLGGSVCTDFYDDNAGKMMASTSAGTIYRSSDNGATWTLSYTNPGGNPVTTVCFGGGRF